MINLNSINDSDANILIQNVESKYKPIFDRGNYSSEEKRAIYRYFFSQRPKKLPPSLKSRLVNLYDPLADRSKSFPDGLRFCLNVYVGCEHACKYCYVNGYSKESVGNSYHEKSGFKEKLIKDINEIRKLQVPTAPIHLSNSTDICQENLETNFRHTLFALKTIANNRDTFSSIALLTKNPKILCEKEYLSIIKSPSMKPLVVQITCAYWNDDARKFYEPDAPSIQSRLDALQILSENNVEIQIRIDPLLPSSRIKGKIRGHKQLSHYSLPEAQSTDDLVNLIRFAKKAGVKSIIGKPLKIPISNKAKQAKELFGNLYTDSFPDGKRKVQGGSWRLPEEYQKEMISNVAEICEREGIVFKHCKHDLLTRK
jgi:DNA repair photolyase